jgi:hypothetical protein
MQPSRRHRLKTHLLVSAVLNYRLYFKNSITGVPDRHESVYDFTVSGAGPYFEAKRSDCGQKMDECCGHLQVNNWEKMLIV